MINYQKLFLVSSVLVSGSIGLLTMPAMARNFTPEMMRSISLILLMGALFGVFDVMRPVFTRAFLKCRVDSFLIPVKTGFIFSLFLGVIISSILFFAGTIFFLDYFSVGSLFFIASGALFFFLSIVFWSVLESTNRVGLPQIVRGLANALLYLAYCSLSFSFVPIIIYGFLFAITQFLVCIVFYFFSKEFIDWKNTKINIWATSDVYDTIKVNLSRLLIDFFDRLLYAKLFPANLFSAYAVIYDATSKMNIPTQYINAYSYPNLCNIALERTFDKFNKEMRRHLAIALTIMISMLVLSLIISFNSNNLVAFYAGNKYREYGYLLVLLTLVSALYSLSFYAQTFLRSVGDFSGLARAFNYTAILGIILGGTVYELWGVSYLIVMVVFLKSIGIGVFLRALHIYYSRWLCILCAATIYLYIAYLVFVSIEDYMVSLFCVSGVLLISSIIYNISGKLRIVEKPI